MERTTSQSEVARLAQERLVDIREHPAFCRRCRWQADPTGDLIHAPGCQAKLEDIAFVGVSYQNKKPNLGA